MQADSETVAPVAEAPPAEEAPKSEEKKVEDTAPPRRSSRISATSKPAAENGNAKDAKKSATSKKRSAADVAADDKVQDATNGAKKARTAKSKRSAAEAVEGLALGEPLPALDLKNEKGEDIKVQDLAGESAGVVLFLVPKADTPGCTTQACGFRDAYPDFEALNFKVFCLSGDSPAAQSKWQTKKSLPYPLLSDPKRTLISVLTGSSAKTPRSHFVFAKGKLVDKKMPVKPVDSPRLALEFVKSLGADETAEASTAPAESSAETDAPIDTDVKAAAETEAEAEAPKAPEAQPEAETAASSV